VAGETQPKTDFEIPLGGVKVKAAVYPAPQ